MTSCLLLQTIPIINFHPNKGIFEISFSGVKSLTFINPHLALLRALYCSRGQQNTDLCKDSDHSELARGSPSQVQFEVSPQVKLWGAVLTGRCPRSRSSAHSPAAPSGPSLGTSQSGLCPLDPGGLKQERSPSFPLHLGGAVADSLEFHFSQILTDAQARWMKSWYSWDRGSSFGAPGLGTLCLSGPAQ